MSSLYTRIKNLIYNKIINRDIVHKRRTYNILRSSQQMFVNGSGSEPEPEPEPEKENITTIKLFNTEIPENTVTSDYELEELIKIITNNNIIVDNVVLHKSFEDKLMNLEYDIVFKTKMRLLYVIIANNAYRSVFDEKKLYKSSKTKYLVGVFQYNSYIIRIDDSPYCFLDEQNIITTLQESNTNDVSDIVVPYFTHINMKKNAKGGICDCDYAPCGCDYGDGDRDADGDGDGDGDYSRVYHNKLRYNTISFSIQPYIKNTESLHTWTTNYITENVNINFLKIKFTFFIHLFYKCALLIQKIHSIGIVHGDIKPDNILIKEEPGFLINDPVKCKLFSVYLIDFGLSGKDNVGIGTGGTIPYCHPEFRNIRDTKRTEKYHWSVVKKKHDVWSLGLMFITLYIHRAFYSYYYKYPSYFFNSTGYVSTLVLDSIGNKRLCNLFSDILSYDSTSIDDVCERIPLLSQTIEQNVF